MNERTIFVGALEIDVPEGLFGNPAAAQTIIAMADPTEFPFEVTFSREPSSGTRSS